MSQPFVRSLLDISSHYQTFLCDAYGVFWNGSAIYSGALDTFSQLMQDGKHIIIVSNSTQPGVKEEEKYANHGLFRHRHYHYLVTSGDATKALISNGLLPFATPNKKVWVFGGKHPKYGEPHLRIFEGSQLETTEDIDRADFIYVGIPHFQGDDQTDPEVFRSSIAQLAKSNLPMLCANPDRFAQEGYPARFVVRQGSIAALYEEYGGKVFYIGKPFPYIYSVAMEMVKQLSQDPGKILMVGDNFDTDIAGAHRIGIDSALVYKTGITGSIVEAEGLQTLLDRLQPEQLPNYWVESFG